MSGKTHQTLRTMLRRVLCNSERVEGTLEKLHAQWTASVQVLNACWNGFVRRRRETERKKKGKNDFFE